MSKVIIFLFFTIYFIYISYENFKRVEKNCNDKEQLLFACTVGFTIGVIMSIENFGCTLEALVELLGGV